MFVMEQKLNIVKNESNELPNNIEAAKSVLGSTYKMKFLMILAQ